MRERARADINDGGGLAMEMLLVDNPPSTMQLIARSLVHMVERGASR